MLKIFKWNGFVENIDEKMPKTAMFKTYTVARHNTVAANNYTTSSNGGGSGNESIIDCDYFLIH